MTGEVLRPPKPKRRVMATQISRVRHPQSSKSGIILFIGEENSGKSSTLNFLFGDQQISPIGREVGTTEILEFCSTNPVENLRLIDVPGLAKSVAYSVEWDAQILASLKKLLDTDKELSRCIPHAVILVSRFDNSGFGPGFGHPESKFVKTLKALSLLKARLFDEHNSNLIIVLTHYMNGRRKDRIDPYNHFDKVKQLVRIQLELSEDPFVIPAENDAYELNLPQIPGTGFYQLSNGELYPDNLIRALYTIAKNSKSLIAIDFFRFVFDKRQHVNFIPLTPISMVDPQRRRFVKFLEALKIVYSRSTI